MLWGAILMLFNIAVRIDAAQTLAPDYPLRVIAPDHASSSEIVYYCHNFVSYMRDQWKITPPQPAYITIVCIDSKPSRFSHTPTTSATIYFKPNELNAEKFLCSALADIMLTDMISKQTKHTIDSFVPRYITEGIAAIFLQDKINPRFNEARRLIRSETYIPITLCMSIRADLSPEMQRLFELQSCYFMEWLNDHNITGEKLCTIIKAYNADSKKGIDTLVHALSCSSLEHVEQSFIQDIERRSDLYNFASVSQKLTEHEIRQIIDDVMCFELSISDKQSRQTETKKATEITIADLPYISTARIEEKILLLRTLEDSGILQEKIKNYIHALDALKTNDFEQYYDYIYMAQRDR